MKSPPAIVDDCDDIFGPPRTYPTGYCPPKTRPSMISAKYRQKEERRKVLKISINKLKKIEDPEASLCRSVLINNTMKRLQKEARDEKLQKQQLNYPRCYDNDNMLNIKSEFIKNENKLNYIGEGEEFTTTTITTTNENVKVNEEIKMDFVVENDFDTKLAEEINAVNAKNVEVLNGLVEENLTSLETTFTNNNNNNTTTTNLVITENDRFSTRKRSFEDMEDCDVQDVLSQFYMPPTPRMLTCIDDDEDVNVVDTSESTVKRIKLDDTIVALQQQQQQVKIDNFSETTVMSEKSDNFSVNNFLNNATTSTEARLRYTTTQNETDTNPYSCGHASMFNELQSNVYHNLIASLET